MAVDFRGVYDEYFDVIACDRGCFVCGPEGQQQGHPYGCCGSKTCDQSAWHNQIERWVIAEEKFNYTLWLKVEKATQEEWCAAEAAFREELRSKPKVQQRVVPQSPNSPARQRELAADRRRVAQGRTQ